MLEAPLKWSVRGLAWLPDAVRPGLFLALAVLFCWLVLVQRGVPGLWHGICRALARIADLLVSVALFPEYLFTTARRRQGRVPGQSVLVLGSLTDVVFDATASFYERHQRESRKWKSPPWKACLVVFVLCTGAWIAMEEIAPPDKTKRALAEGFEYWREVEAWAEVGPSERAAPGDAFEPPSVRHVSLHGRSLRVGLYCPGKGTCSGFLVLSGRSGSHRTKPVTLPAGGATSFTFVLVSREDRAPHGVRLRIEKA